MWLASRVAGWGRSEVDGVVTVLLLWYRVFTPIRQAFRHRLRVEGVRMEGPDVVSVYLTGRRLDRSVVLIGSVRSSGRSPTAA